MKTKLLVVALITILFSSTVMAWGDREQGIISGIAGLWIFQQLSRPNQFNQIPVPQGHMIGQYPTNTLPYIMIPQCRQVLAIQQDRFGNQFYSPITACN